MIYFFLIVKHRLFVHFVQLVVTMKYGVNSIMEEKNSLRMHFLKGASVMAVLSFILIILIWQSRTGEQTTLNQAAKGSKEIVVIDPGHGGIQTRPKKSGLESGREKEGEDG